MNEDTLTDGEIDAIVENAYEAAVNAWGPAAAPNCRQNPYPAGSERAEVWDHAFRNAYAMENGK